MLTRAKIDKIFQYWFKENPNPQTELEYTNHFTLAVAVILSAQATDVSVNKATKTLFAKYSSPKELLSLGESGLNEYIKSIGLHNSKAKNIIALCKILIESYDSKIPNNFDDLIKLPGIGEKTANVILHCAFGRPTIAVDTHVFRVANRIGLSKEKTATKVSKELMKVIPQKWIMGAHHWIILHGRYICKARKPLCNQCGIRENCEYYNTNEAKE